MKKDKAAMPKSADNIEEAKFELASAKKSLKDQTQFLSSKYFIR